MGQKWPECLPSLERQCVQSNYLRVAKPSLREDLLEAGQKVLWEHRYAAAGVRDTVAEAGARPGSFTNHFASKEDFVGEVVDRYFACVSSLVEAALADDGLAPTQQRAAIWTRSPRRSKRASGRAVT
jgi:AcrR family transcriptional regulator